MRFLMPLLALAFDAVGQTAPVQPHRPVATYSIVARDAATGEIGVAVQSHWFSVGSVVPWAEAGVGAVATQSMVDPAYGPLGLAQMRLGRSAPEALRALVAGDPAPALRQVAMIDAQGRVAAHTGDRCIAFAGMIVDETAQFSVQANLMANDRVWPAMARAFRETRGDLATRMLAALEAAEAAGGDVRGRQSAALVVVNRDATGKPWIDRKFDLRVEDHPEPVSELRRLVALQRAYALMNEGDAAAEKNDFVAAGKAYAAAAALAPAMPEIRFWHAAMLANGGRVDEALPIFREVFAAEPFWADVVPRIAASAFFPKDATTIEKVLSVAPKR